MANLRYYNNSAPFWDFIASLEDKDFSSHPFFARWNGQNQNENNNNNQGNEDAAGPSNSRQPNPKNEEADRETTVDHDAPMEDPAEVVPEEWSPWEGNSWGFGGPRGFMRGGRGRGGHGRGGHGRFPPGWPQGHHSGPPPPPGGEHPPPPPPPAEGEFPAPPGGEEAFHGPPHAGPEHGTRHYHGGPGPHRGGVRGRGGRCGGRGRDGPPPFWKKNGMPFDMSNLAEFFQSQLFGNNTNERSNDNSNGDFTPPVDIFDTEAAFVIHVSLPGAKKEDIAVNWDTERSEVNITGVIHRPGDEEFLKTLALDERKVGAFSRKVRLGSRVNPAQVDAEGISAKLEEGILRVNVPKEDKEFDVIHKIDIE